MVAKPMTSRYRLNRRGRVAALLCSSPTVATVASANIGGVEELAPPIGLVVAKGE